MVLYVDIVIILTLLVNYFFLEVIGLLTHMPFKWYRIIIALLLSCASLMMFFIPIKVLYNLRYLMGIGIIFIAFPIINIYHKILEIVLYYFLNFAFIGVLSSTRQHTLLMLIISLMTVIVLLIMAFQTKKMNISARCFIQLGKKTYVGFWDTGNTSIDNDIPIVFVRSSFKNGDYHFVKEIPITTIKGIDLYKIYDGPLLKIGKKQYKVRYCFCELSNKEIILNWRMKHD